MYSHTAAVINPDPESPAKLDSFKKSWWGRFYDQPGREARAHHPARSPEPAAGYTRAKLFQVKGTKTPVTIRFSTVIGGRDSAEAARDPRGFAIKFRTSDGPALLAV